MKNKQYDTLIIGCGAAGLGLALSLANDAKIALVSKGPLTGSSSQHAQGGIAAVMSQTDDYQSHIQDTLNTGVGLCDQNAVEFTVTHAKKAIQWLIDHGVKFTLDDNQQHYHLTQEGGHSHRRILHAADKTGAVVIETLSKQARNHPNIDCYTEETAVDLITQSNRCYGAIILNNKDNSLHTLLAKTTVLATGGASSVYLHTSNPDITSGDGISMAWRAGCRVADLEFNQFHPTCLYNENGETYLITEAVRGEGGILTLPNGKRFMPKYDERAELAPRDIVARAIHHEMRQNKLNYVYLDISHSPAEKIKKYFPTIYTQCLKHNIDITCQPIPIVPAAHYTCGGVTTNLNGQTDINCLYAIGEVACTGLHGANRMASNSLLECLVFAASASKAIKKQLANDTLSQPLPEISLPTSGEHLLNTEPLTRRLRTLMWENVSIVRNTCHLETAKQLIKKMQGDLNENLSRCQLNKAIIEYRNMLTTAELVVRCALQRKESRGLHYNIDYPNTAAIAKHTVLTPKLHRQTNPA